MQAINKLLLLSYTCFLLFSSGNTATAQTAQQDPQPAKKHKHKTGAIYFSWGYNHEWYTKSTVHVKQDALGNNYDLVSVTSHDHKGWDNGLTRQQISIPQYNYRLGYYFNEKQDMGIEINFDHTKYIITDGENVHLRGTLNHAATDESLIFSQQNGFYYYLNNGANFLLFNFVKRVGLYNTHDHKFAVDLTGKAGIGPVIPHVQNSFFGQANDPHFQFGGWNTGVETALRVTIMRYVYFEFSQKVDYARYSNLKIYDGTAKQNFGTYELILSAGVIVPTTKHHPMFTNDVTPLPGPDNKD